MTFPRGSWRPKLLPRFTYAGQRVTEVIDSDGYESITTVDFSIENASGLQPVSGYHQLTVPENLRERGVFRIFTTTVVNTVDELGTTDLADRVVIDGETFITLTSKPWKSKVQNHYEVMLVREPI